MNCRRCGKNNRPNAKYCAYCGMTLSAQKKKNNQKQTEGVIVALIIVLVLILTIVVGVVIYKNNNPRNVSYGGGSEGDSLPPPRFATNDLVPSEEEYENDYEDIEIPTEEPRRTERPSVSDRKLIKQEEFLDRAYDIEVYSENYLETAETQLEINNESGIVFQKWDILLNEVYQYLETIMTDNEFANLQEDELDWIMDKENAIEASASEWEGGSGEIMARNFTAISYTKERCYYLISLII